MWKVVKIHSAVVIHLLPVNIVKQQLVSSNKKISYLYLMHTKQQFHQQKHLQPVTQIQVSTVSHKRIIIYHVVCNTGSNYSASELIIIIAASVAGAAVFLLIFGAVVFLRIRKKLIQRAKIVDISQVSKSIAAQETQSSILKKTQFMVNNSDKTVYFINFSQSPIKHSENDVEETAN